MGNSVEYRNARKAERTECVPGKMPSNWNAMTNAQRAAFTQAERKGLRDGNFMWSPTAPEHGVWNSYNNYFCRCPGCKRANARMKAGWQGQERVVGDAQWYGQESV